MKAINKLVLTLSLTALAGCVTPPTWTNRGHEIVEISGRGMITCYTDANIIDGERMEGALCATPASGFLSDGEPEILFGPYGRRFIRMLASESTVGAEREWHGTRFFVQCEPIESVNSRSVPDRKCSVKANGQHLMSATFVFKG
ncbi:hypothetical protein [Pseudomonas fulva]|uniref:hypothetical protein n=1 Tax=Pseudomonas fulva TaxID=47880 RepID=UPI0005A16CE8|nr:hypothetical protein [Pseudomonas fulva]